MLGPSDDQWPRCASEIKVTDGTPQLNRSIAHYGPPRGSRRAKDNKLAQPANRMLRSNRMSSTLVQPNEVTATRTKY